MPSSLAPRDVLVAAVADEERALGLDAELRRGPRSKIDGMRLALARPPTRRPRRRAARRGPCARGPVQEPAGIERVRDEADLEARGPVGVEERVRLRSDLARRAPRPRARLRGTGRARRRSRSTPKPLQQLAHHARVLDLVERARAPRAAASSARGNARPCPRDAGSSSRPSAASPASQPASSSASSYAKWKSVSPQSKSTASTATVQRVGCARLGAQSSLRPARARPARRRPRPLRGVERHGALHPRGGSRSSRSPG